MLRSGRRRFASLLISSFMFACSSASSDTPSDEPDCLTRCNAIAEHCGGSAKSCDESCDSLTSKQLSCIERADCDDKKSLACLGQQTSKDETVPDDDECVSGCVSLGKKCGTSTDKCEAKCKKFTEEQWRCSLEAGCDLEAQLACVGTTTSGPAIEAGVFAEYVYETSKVGLQGYGALEEGYVAKLTLYLEADGDYVLYYRRGKGKVSEGQFTFSTDGIKFVGKWSVTEDEMTVGDILHCVKSAKVTCALVKDVEPGVTGIEVPMNFTNRRSPTDPNEWKPYKPAP